MTDEEKKMYLAERREAKQREKREKKTQLREAAASVTVPRKEKVCVPTASECKSYRF